MAEPLSPDGLWEIIEPLLLPQMPSPKGGRPPVPHRAALTGILFVLKTGIGWEDLPSEMNCGSGMTCWRRLRDWQFDGTWDKIRAVLLERFDEAGRIDWPRGAIDSSSVAGRHPPGVPHARLRQAVLIPHRPRPKLAHKTVRILRLKVRYAVAARPSVL